MLFLGTPRNRTVPWEVLQRKRVLGEELNRPEAITNTASENEYTDEAKIDRPGGVSATSNWAAEEPVEKKNPPHQMATPRTPSIDEIRDGKEQDVTVGQQKIDATNGQENVGAPGPAYDVMLGVSGSYPPQYGILGESSGRKVAMDLNQTHTISLFGVQGGGKSYTLGSIVEMATLPNCQINCLPQPLATVIFHYSQTMDYAPEFTSMVNPNRDSGQIQELLARYQGRPQGLSDVVLLVPRGQT